MSDFLTACTIFDTVIERRYELGKDGIDIVQSSQDFDDVRTGVGVFLCQDDIEEHC